MNIGEASLQLRRLRVMSEGRAVYDQPFHSGVNIIRGKNGSGKSTIADFIFFSLGGEFDSWKEYAAKCDEVQVELKLTGGYLTVRRETSKKSSDAKVFFGRMDEAAKQPFDNWHIFPLHRRSGNQSFSQTLFRMMGIPDAPSEGSSNVTIHQLLRLMYSDQRTPPGRLFRFEQFDTQNMRMAVGDLMCGVVGYEAYDVAIALRETEKRLEKVSVELKGLFDAFPAETSLGNVDTVIHEIEKLAERRDELDHQLQNVDELVQGRDVDKYEQDRRSAKKELTNLKKEVSKLEDSIREAELNLEELGLYLEHLTDSLGKVVNAEETSSSIGELDLTYCPSCLVKLRHDKPEGCCQLCGEKIDEDRAEKYSLVKIDLTIQIRETNQLIDVKADYVKRSKKELSLKRSDLKASSAQYSASFGEAAGPRDAFIAEKANEIGEITQKIKYLSSNLNVAERISELVQAKADLSDQKDRLAAQQGALERSAAIRRKVALGRASQIAVGLLKNDLQRQEEFSQAKSVGINFLDDAVDVDGKFNFAESSNVFLKNSAILSLLLAAGEDKKFFHPRFLLMDNIEDKGMEVERSHKFQELIVKYVTECPLAHQVIFTTSMMNPELELNDYVVGPAYTTNKRTLDFSF
ncbi:AAA family ATPase [Thalassospira lucentensis]|uniref:AAA family ATPase n=1 Tax=Thalassospira lucentensis TaxID=168935 RepID=UPI003D2F18BD